MKEFRDLAQNRLIRAAICGIRGIPACYGGFETFAEELAPRLIDRGLEVVVYGREHVIDYKGAEYKGAKIRLIPAPKHKYLETPVHTLLCLIDIAKRRDIDVILVCNAANSPFLWLPRIFGIPVAVNVDGVERKRAKWNMLGRLWYLLGEITSVLFANKVVADAQVISDYYKRTYRAKTEVISYGFREVTELKSDILSDLKIKSKEYLLYVSRLEPENNAHVVIKAYRELPKAQKKFPLVIVGDAPYANEYKQQLNKLAEGENIIFAGYRFGDDYPVLQQNAYLYIQATEVGGTHPALVEAMGFGNCVVANDVPEHREVLRDTGVFYSLNSSSSLAEKLALLLKDKKQVENHRKSSQQRATKNYSWELVADQYYELLSSLA